MLLDNLLQWSRLQTKTLPFVPAEQKLHKLVQDELFFVINIAAEKKVSIKTDIEEDMYITADGNMLKTIVRNLMSNSIKFSRKGGRILVAAKRDESETIISVKDNGMGISPEVKEKLFTGEAGVSTTGSSGEKGTGLGLMLCKDFINAHGGRIWVESELDVGSTFSFSIPRYLEEQNQ
jgi:signal transduction histidine kinase